MPKPFTTVEEIQAVSVQGDAYSDGDTWERLYATALDDTTPMEVMLEILRMTNRLTGENEPVNEEAVAQFRAETKMYAGNPL